MNLTQINATASWVLSLACIYSGVVLQAPDLLLYAALLLGGLAIERLPWADIAAPLLRSLRMQLAVDKAAEA
jgi:hypothetical protein